MGERTVRIRKVAGSIPVRSTKNAAHRFRLAKFVRPRFFHRGIIPLLTLFFSASGSQKTAVTPCGGSVPWRPSLITRASGSFLPPHSPTHRAQVRSEFLPQGHTAAILFSLASPGGITHPGKPTPLPGNARELLPPAIPFSLASPGGITHPGIPTPLPGNARDLLPARGGLRLVRFLL